MNIAGYRVVFSTAAVEQAIGAHLAHTLLSQQLVVGVLEHPIEVCILRWQLL